jgi:hypothetical protein
MPRFLLLARDDNSAWSGLSPAEAEAIIMKYVTWSQRLRENGHLTSSDKLRDGEGKVLGRKAGKLVVTDGPFAEVKEIVGGYWLLQAGTYAEVEKLAADCPHLEFGTLEIRMIEEME